MNSICGSHMYVVEPVYAFTCGFCFQEWSVKGYDLGIKKNLYTVCPNCSRTAPVKLVEGSDD